MKKTKEKAKPKIKQAVAAEYEGKGRPTKYKPEHCQMLIDHMKTGYSFESFAAVINVNKDTIYEWSNSQPEFSEAKKIAFSLNLLFWEKMGMQGMWESNDKEATKLNTALYIFSMKARHGWTDKPAEKPKEEVRNNQPQIVITLPDNGMSAKED